MDDDSSTAMGAAKSSRGGSSSLRSLKNSHYFLDFGRIARRDFLVHEMPDYGILGNNTGSR